MITETHMTDKELVIKGYIPVARLSRSATLVFYKIMNFSKYVEDIVCRCIDKEDERYQIWVLPDYTIYSERDFLENVIRRFVSTILSQGGD